VKLRHYLLQRYTVENYIVQARCYRLMSQITTVWRHEIALARACFCLVCSAA